MKKRVDMCFVTNKRFDVSGEEASRVGKHCVISKFARYENFGGGPGLKYLLVIFILHYSGRLSGWIVLFFEKQIRAFLRLFYHGRIS